MPPELTDPEAIEEKRRAEIPLHGNAETFNLNPLLYNNIVGTEYFIVAAGPAHVRRDRRRDLRAGHARRAVGDRHAARAVERVLPARQAVVPRDARADEDVLLNHGDSPHIRLLGFLYLRYATPPAELWAWFAPHLDDEEPVAYTHDPPPTSRPLAARAPAAHRAALPQHRAPAHPRPH